MSSFTDLFKKEHMGELILVILLIIYLVMVYSTPRSIATLIDTIGGKILIFVIVICLFIYSNPILAVIALFVAFDLMRRSSMVTGSEYISKYANCQDEKSTQFTAFNQFPYTLEQEVVKKMAPIVQSGTTLTKASYTPILDDNYNATPLH